VVGRTGRRTVAEKFWTVQNSLRRLFDRSAIGLLLVCAHTARTVVAVRSSTVAVLLHSIYGRTSVLRLHRDCGLILRPQNERTAAMGDHTANAVAVGLLKSLYSRSTVGRFAFRVQCKNTAIRCDLTAIERRPRWDLRRPSAIWSRRKSQLGVTGVLQHSCSASKNHLIQLFMLILKIRYAAYINSSRM